MPVTISTSSCEKFKVANLSWCSVLNCSEEKKISQLGVYFKIHLASKPPVSKCLLGKYTVGTITQVKIETDVLEHRFKGKKESVSEANIST